MPTTVSPDAVRSALSHIVDPDLRKDLVSLNFVKDLSIEGGRVAFTIEIATPLSPAKAQLAEQARAAVAAIEGVEAVDVRLASQVRSATPPEDARRPLPGGRDG